MLLVKICGTLRNLLLRRHGDSQSVTLSPSNTCGCHGLLCPDFAATATRADGAMIPQRVLRDRTTTPSFPKCRLVIKGLASSETYRGHQTGQLSLATGSGLLINATQVSSDRLSCVAGAFQNAVGLMGQSVLQFGSMVCRQEITMLKATLTMIAVAMAFSSLPATARQAGPDYKLSKRSHPSGIARGTASRCGSARAGVRRWSKGPHSSGNDDTTSRSPWGRGSQQDNFETERNPSGLYEL
jgi:hypothetical protein